MRACQGGHGDESAESPSWFADIAIIGAGVAGLAAAQALRAHGPRGLKIQILEKAGQPGGRLRTRQDRGGLCDSTAQFFTARSPEWKSLVAHWVGRGVLAPWFTKPDDRGGSEPVYMAPQGMGRFMMHWAIEHQVACGAEVTGLATSEKKDWELSVSRSVFAGPAKLAARCVVATAPWPSLSSWMDPWAAGLSEADALHLRGIQYASCLVLELALEGEGRVAHPGMEFMPSAEIACVADQGAKGLRGGQGRLAILFSPDFSGRNWERAREGNLDVSPGGHGGNAVAGGSLMAEMLALAKPWMGGSTVAAATVTPWRHARVTRAFPGPFLRLPAAAPLLLAGDGFGGPRVEGAFLSGWQAGLEAARLISGHGPGH